MIIIINNNIKQYNLIYIKIREYKEPFVIGVLYILGRISSLLDTPKILEKFMPFVIPYNVKQNK
jgi:hypothetical protein